MSEKLFGGKFSATIGKKIHVAEVQKPGGSEDETIQVIQFDINAMLDESQLRNYREGIADHVFATTTMCFKTIDFGEQVEATFTLNEIIGVTRERPILPEIKWRTLKVTGLDHTPQLVIAKLSCESPYIEAHFLELARLKSLKTEFILTKIQGELELDSEPDSEDNIQLTISDGQTEVHTSTGKMSKLVDNFKE